MTEEDWSGTGEASDTPSANPLSEPAAEAADDTWGESAIGETSDELERSIAVPAVTRSTSRSSRSSSRWGSTRSSTTRKKSAAKRAPAKKASAKKKSAAKKKTAARKTTARKT